MTPRNKPPTVKKRKRAESDSDSGSEFETKKSKLAVAKGSKGNIAQSQDYESLMILHLDVDQGACTLVIYTQPDGARWTAVIDGGHGNPGRGQIVRYLESLDIESIDYLFLTHYDADHADGIADLINHHGPWATQPVVKMSTTLCYSYENKAQPPVKFAQSRNVKREQAAMGVLKSSGDFKITVVAANFSGDENARSLALSIEFGAFKYLTCGDLPTEHEDGVAQQVGRTDIIYCSHHGSAYSTSEAMLGYLKNPPIAVISAGRNPFGHPNSETLARFPKDPSQFRAYLTGCQFNRKYINADYYETERTNLSAALTSALDQFDLALTADTVKNMAAAITDCLEYFKEESFTSSDLDPESAKSEMKKWVQELLKDKDLSTSTDTKKFFGKLANTCKQLVNECTDVKSTTSLPTFGHVSGARNAMGPVGIRISSKGDMVDVGFHQEDGWSWRHRWERKGERLVQAGEILEYDMAIGSAIPNIPSVTDSPGKFKGWQAIRSAERELFSLSSRTPRKPLLTVDYKCRWCDKSGSEDMVLVVCEHCQAAGYVIAYHSTCLESAAMGGSGRNNGYIKDKYPLWPHLKEFLASHDSKETPVLVPAQWEACHFCGTFRPQNYKARIEGIGARGRSGKEKRRHIRQKIHLRRGAHEADELDNVASPDDEKWIALDWETFGEFYEQQKEAGIGVIEDETMDI